MTVSDLATQVTAYGFRHYTNLTHPLIPEISVGVLLLATCVSLSAILLSKSQPMAFAIIQVLPIPLNPRDFGRGAIFRCECVAVSDLTTQVTAYGFRHYTNLTHPLIPRLRRGTLVATLRGQGIIPVVLCCAKP